MSQTKKSGQNYKSWTLNSCQFWVVWKSVKIEDNINLFRNESEEGRRGRIHILFFWLEDTSCEFLNSLNDDFRIHGDWNSDRIVSRCMTDFFSTSNIQISFHLRFITVRMLNNEKVKIFSHISSLCDSVSEISLAGYFNFLFSLGS